MVGLVLLVFTLWIGLRMEPTQANGFVRHYGYFFTAAGMFAFLTYIVWWAIRKTRGSGANSWLPMAAVGVFTVAMSTTVVFYGGELDYKILMDDYLLSATAKSMHETGEVSVADFGREINGEFTVVQSFVDKRPWFYPFLVSLVHDTAGYHPVHAFAVNAALAVVFLCVVFALGYCLGGYGGAILAVLLWASLPLLQQNATGGGMEMLNLLMIHVVILLSIYYLRAPCAEGEGALCLAAVLLTYSRYESGLFIAAILVVIALGWRRQRQVFLSLPALCAAPILLAAFLQTRIYAATESSWELSDSVTAPFALSHLWANIPHAFAFLWSGDLAIANSLLLGMLAIPAGCGFIFLCVRKRKSDWWTQPSNQVWVIFSIFLILNLLVVLCFHAAQFDKRYVARYSLPTHGLIVFSTVSCLAALRPQRWVWGVSIVLTVLCLGLVTFPENGQALYSKANFMVAEQHWLESLDAEYRLGNALVIDRFNTAWTLRERAALPPHVALISADRIEAELITGKYSDLYLVERLTDSENGLQAQVPAVETFRSMFDSELIEDNRFKGGMLTRVYLLRPDKPLK